MSHDDNLAEFVGITSCDPELARVFMEKCFWNVEMAVSQYFENPGRYTAADLKAIDVDDDVRAPIEPKRQVLQDQMDDDDGVVYEVVQRGRPRVSRSRTSMEAFRSFNDEQRYLREIRTGKRTGSDPNRTKSLAELFMPPLELLYRGPFNDAKEAAERERKYLLINIQSASEFSSQRLNRDTWSDRRVKDIIKSRYVMWQVDKDSHQATEYLQWYDHDGPPPYIAVLDPRTGERLWSRGDFIDADNTLQCLKSILIEHPWDPDSVVEVIELDGTPKRGRATDKATTRPDPSLLSEEEQLAAAIAASLVEDTSATTTATEPTEKKRQYDSSDEEPEEAFPDDDDDISLLRTAKRKAETSTVIESEPKRTKPQESDEENDRAEEADEDILGGPEETTPKDCTLNVRLPSGAPLQLSFNNQDTLSTVAKHVRVLGKVTKPFALLTTFPKRRFLPEEFTVTLSDAKLTGRAVLIAELL